jgi:hypothetical protein
VFAIVEFLEPIADICLCTLAGDEASAGV